MPADRLRETAVQRGAPSMKHLILLALILGSACTPIPGKTLFVYQTEEQKTAALADAKAAGADADAIGGDTATPDTPLTDADVGLTDADAGLTDADGAVTDVIPTADNGATDITTPPDALPPDGAPDVPVVTTDIFVVKCGDGVCSPGENKTLCAADCYCDNGTCDQGETFTNCSVDCCKCGDSVCETMNCKETLELCPTDCAACGDGACSPGEKPSSCPVDCCGACGDDLCKCNETAKDPAPDNFVSCPQDCLAACGNTICEKGENTTNCSADCDTKACGNGKCESTEGPEICPGDCKTACGDCVCDKGEDPKNCPMDCGSCGDGTCSNCPQMNEKEDCPADCIK